MLCYLNRPVVITFLLITINISTYLLVDKPREYRLCKWTTTLFKVVIFCCIAAWNEHKNILSSSSYSGLLITSKWKKDSSEKKNHYIDKRSPPVSVFCWSTFCFHYSLKTFGILLYQLFMSRLCNIWPLILTELFKVSQIRWCLLVDCNLSVGFMSGLWQGHAKTFTFLSLSHCVVSFAVLQCALGHDHVGI